MTADSLLKLWAVIGPLLAAAASAVWSRHTLKQDRQYDDAREKETLARDLASQDRAYLRLKAENQASDLKNAITDFLSSTHEYVRKESLSRTNSTPESIAISVSAYDRLSSAGQAVIVLADDELEEATTEFWNATSEAPRSYTNPADDPYIAAITRYRKARHEFTRQAKRYLLEISSRVP